MKDIRCYRRFCALFSDQADFALMREVTARALGKRISPRLYGLALGCINKIANDVKDIVSCEREVTAYFAAIVQSDCDHLSESELCALPDALALCALRSLVPEGGRTPEFCAALLVMLAKLDFETFFEGVSYSHKRLLAASGIYAELEASGKRRCRERFDRLCTAGEANIDVGIADIVSGKTEEHGPLPARIYFILLALLTLLVSLDFYALSGFDAISGLLLILPVSELCRRINDRLFESLTPCGTVDRLELEHIPDEGRTLTVMTVQMSDSSADSFASLERCYLSNRDDNIRFALLLDPEPSPDIASALDKPRVKAAKAACLKLNDRHGDRFYLFTRPRVYSRSESCFIGWERKRGALLELCRFLRGVESSVSCFGADRSFLSGVRYIAALDSDTEPDIGSLRKLVGVMLHPANRPVIADGAVCSGCAVLQPRMLTTLSSASATPFSVMNAGAGGWNCYAAASFGLYQKLFGESVWCGKGIFDLAAYLEVLDEAFRQESVLSHDLLEGARLRCMQPDGVFFSDSAPRTPLSHFDRLHRWIRGDVQALAFTKGKIRADSGALVRNPIPALSRYELWDNLRRHLVPLFAAAAILRSTFIPNGGAVLCCALAYLLPPLLFALAGGGGGRFYSRVLTPFRQQFYLLLYELASLPQLALITADAVFRASWRMIVSRRHLLEWRPSDRSDRLNAPSACFLRMLPTALVGLSAVLWGGYPSLRLLGIIWLTLPSAAFLLSRPFKPAKALSPAKKAQLTRYAFDLWSYFDKYVTAEDNYLPPDNVQLCDGARIAHRTSPTDIGLYLLSCAAARDFGFIGDNELFERLSRALGAVCRLRLWRGQLYNWYDTETLEVMAPAFVSSVDSGNFLVSLVALRETLRQYVERDARFESLIPKISRLLTNAEPAALYDRRRRLFFVGCCPDRPELQNGARYDLYMSETRLLSYFAIAREDVPPNHFSALSRPLSGRGGRKFALSWSGTAFEYFMPRLFLPAPENSFSFETLCVVSRLQTAKLSGCAGFFGVSESACYDFDENGCYRYRAFGLGALAINPEAESARVISPYSSFLMLPFRPSACMRNLKRLRNAGVYGPHGFWEAIDFTPERAGGGFAIVRMCMAHHAAMSIIAAANACFDDIFMRRFMSDPEMAGADGLLCERVPISGQPNVRRTIPSSRRTRSSAPPQCRNSKHRRAAQR